MEDQTTRNPASASADGTLTAATGRWQNHDTYIVQFPKDQVYRVPPRENALIVEQYRNPGAVKKRRGGCCCLCSRRCLVTVALIVITIVAVVGITLATLFFIFSPKIPIFSVSNVEVKNGKGTRPVYEVLLNAKNPNERLRIDYECGDVWVMFRATKVAEGKFPTLEQSGGESSEVMVALSGLNGVLSKKDEPVALKLEMKLGFRASAAGLTTWTMNSNVMCDVEVSSLRNNTSILSQSCYHGFKHY